MWLDVEVCWFGYCDSVFKYELDCYLIIVIELCLLLLYELWFGYVGIGEEM